MANGEDNVICFETCKGEWLKAPAIEHAGIVAVFETVAIDFGSDYSAA